MLKTKVYSPTQVAMGSLLGGPLAAVFFLGQNFARLQNRTALRKTYLYGGVFVVLVFAVLPFLPESFPNYAIPVGYIVVARMIAEKYQMSKRSIAESGAYEFQPIAKVLGLSVVFLIGFFAMFIAWIMGLAHMGFIQL